MIAARTTRSTLALLALVPACSASLPRPPGGPVPASERIEVPYPPPPARVDSVPVTRSAGQVWIDGQWAWAGEAWQWSEGTWTTPPPNAYFTPWSTKRRADGQLLFAAAAWRDPTGRPLDRSVGAQTCAAPAPAAEPTPR